METTVLKNFATAARTQLTKEVAARLNIVVQDSSAVRREFGAAMAELDKAIQAEGGGAAGRRQVAERVAYIWFNRIIALRFMDANHYTDLGIVSPSAGQTAGQPEVLADAKRGHLDAKVVNSKATVERITGLLNGTRRSDDPQREAYGLLLAAYCQAQHRAMPFMFEREGNAGLADYSELLMPADLLSEESIIAKAVKVLTPEVCQDVEVIGWLYQFYIAERKDEVFAGFSKGNKAGTAEIPAATQLFTPHWIVRYLVENSLGRLWLLNRSDSTLAEHMDYYFAPVEPETDFLKISGPEELKILDPACGSGHMLTYAFDLLYTIYEEEGYAPSEIPGLILTNNLYGIEIDPRAGALAAFALTMKARARQRTFLGKGITPNICVLEPIRFSPAELDALGSHDGDRVVEETFFNQFVDADTLGSLIRPKGNLIAETSSKLAVLGDTDLFVTDILSRASRVVMQAEYLSNRYHVVVANPPYMGSKNMSTKLSEWAKSEYPNTSSDLYSMFMERSLELGPPRSYVALITMHSWMFLSTSKGFRTKLLSTTRTVLLGHLGTRAFDSISGEIVATAAFVLQSASTTKSQGVYLRLTRGQNEQEKDSDLRKMARGGMDEYRYLRDPKFFANLPGLRVIYWLSQGAGEIIQRSEPLENRAPAIQGMITGSNSTYLRLWHEVTACRLGLSGGEDESPVRRWVPYNKGGQSRRWYGGHLHIVDWSDEGRSFVRNRSTNRIFYFREYLSWSYRSSEAFSARLYPRGFLWDVAGSGIFPANRETALSLLALLASTTGAYLMSCLNPTSTFQVENILELPVIPDIESELQGSGLLQSVETAIDISRVDWDRYETSWRFEKSPLLELDRVPLLRALSNLYDEYRAACEELGKIEGDINEFFAKRYVLDDLLRSQRQSSVGVTLFSNYSGRHVSQRFGRLPDDFVLDSLRDFFSYAVGCMFGRYSLDKPGLILSNQGETLQDYLAQVPEPSFEPDKDNVIPVLGDDWFDDGIVERFRKFLRVSFGDEYFEENLRFIEEALGKDIRKYFATDFYKDHVQRYKKRPIYWLFSSPKGSFNALIYMHRYIPSTVSTVLNEYLREFQAKLGAALENQQRISDNPSTLARDKARADKEIDKLRKMLHEVRDYEHDVLYPLATRQIAIDLDDGVKANYSKFGVALKKIPALEATSD